MSADDMLPSLSNPRRTKEMAQHTPGPWVMSDGKYRNMRIWAGDSVIANAEPDASEQPRIPDARLIAAAPELLEALERLASLLEIPNVPPGARGLINARIQAAVAIAKARGES